MSLDRIIVKLLTDTTKNNIYFIEEISSLNKKLSGKPYNKSLLKNIIQQKNNLMEGMLITKNNINSLSETSNSINLTLSSLKNTVNTIKSISIPTSTPPGYGIPISILTTYSDSLDKLRELIKQNNEIVKLTPTLTNSISNLIGDMEDEVVLLDNTITDIIDTEVLIRANNSFGENYTPNELNIIKDRIMDELGFQKYPNSESTPFLTNEENILLEQLKPNTTNPIIYEGYKLEIQNNPNNIYSFPSRRIKGTNIKNNQILYNDKGKYSFSSSLKVLISEIKFVIKNNKTNIYNYESKRITTDN